MNITVYLSSKTNVSPSFTEAVVTLATGLGEMGAHLIYGGSNAGQMHILAEPAKAAGATVTVAIPAVLRLLSERVVDGMSYTLGRGERKKKMMEAEQVFVAPTGGIGTIDEVMTTLAAMTISRNFSKRIILVNVDGVFSPLIEQLKLLQDLHLASDDAVATVIVADNASQALDIIKSLNI